MADRYSPPTDTAAWATATTAKIARRRRRLHALVLSASLPALFLVTRAADASDPPRRPATVRGPAPTSTEIAAARFRAQYRRPPAAPVADAALRARVALGRALFFDARLSTAGDRSCASCHDPALGWADTTPTARGTGGGVLGRRTQTLYDIGHGAAFFWDGRAATLEEQATGPITSPGEMNMPLADLARVLRTVPEWRPMTRSGFGDSTLTVERAATAIADFERTIASPRAAFDRWVEGDTRAISEDAKAGFVLFNTKASCAKCHSGWRFTDDSFHDIGMRSTDVGRGAVIEIEELRHAFKTPTLRAVVGRAPYMHDGSERTLEEVVALYDLGGRVKRSTLSPEIRPLGLTATERRQIVAFLRTLGDARAR